MECYGELPQADRRGAADLNAESDAIREFKAGIAQSEAHESGASLKRCLEPVRLSSMHGGGRSNGRCTRGETHAVQNLTGSVRRMDSGENSHAA